MDYYFDESGNWSIPGRERKRLLIGGLLFKDAGLEKRLDQEFRIFRAEQKLATLHAYDLSTEHQELCYGIINEHLTTDTEVLVRIYDIGILQSKTRIDPDQIYADCAADLIMLMSLCDSDIRVYYDMKFHYAYPANIIRNRNTIPWYMKRTGKLFIFDEAKAIKQRDTLLRKIKKQLFKPGLSFSDKKILEGFVSELTSLVSYDEPDSGIQHRLLNTLADYFWTELWLQFDGREKMRETFRTSIMTKTTQAMNLLGMDRSTPSLKLSFLDKQKHQAGIIAIDFICNLVYRHGTEIPTTVSSAVQSILGKINIEEV